MSSLLLSIDVHLSVAPICCSGQGAGIGLMARVKGIPSSGTKHSTRLTATHASVATKPMWGRVSKSQVATKALRSACSILAICAASRNVDKANTLVHNMEEELGEA
jgi:hypothetical protein